MYHEVIQISSEPIGVRSERACYRHSEASTRVLEIQQGACDEQTCGTGPKKLNAPCRETGSVNE